MTKLESQISYTNVASIFCVRMFRLNIPKVTTVSVSPYLLLNISLQKDCWLNFIVSVCAYTQYVWVDNFPLYEHFNAITDCEPLYE